MDELENEAGMDMGEDELETDDMKMGESGDADEIENDDEL